MHETRILTAARVAFASVFGLGLGLGCSSSGSETAPPEDTGVVVDSESDTGVKDSAPADVGDAADAADAKPDTGVDTTPVDTGPPPDTAGTLFDCGTEKCSKTFQFCRVATGGASTCILYPSSCGFPSCGCLVGAVSTMTPAACKADPTPTCTEADGGYTITCTPP